MGGRSVVKNSLYDSLGNPQLITDPNGVKTRYFYDRKGRTTKIVNGSTLSDSTITQYTYNSYGNTKQITLPKGNTIKYNYDFANRLVSTVNGVNDSLKYSYDTENNRTREEVRSSSGVFTRYEDYRYDDRNRLEKIISSVNDTTIKDTTIFRYDQVGNRVFQKNAKGDSVTYRYDDLNRLTIVIQWKDGDSLKTSYSYDSGDNLRTVTDADSNVTSYKYSDKGLLTEDSSSVTGITRYYYNPAGNLTKKKDSQGDSILYSYDALNRLTLIKFQDTTKNIGYVYDTSSSYRMGRLYREVTPNDIITYSYKFTGLLSQEAKNISGVTYTTSYSYDKNGNMTSLTYPKGRVLSYFYDNADRVDSLRGVFNQTTTRYITSMNYAPYGGPTSFTYGNGITTTIKYNYRYLVDSLATNYNVTKRKYYFDKTGNITRIADLLYPAKSESLYYDPLSRLTLAVADSFPGDTIRYTYSDAGNRLTKIIGIDTTFYNYTDNKLASTTGNEPAVYRYDNKGNVIVDSTSSKDTLAYDQLNRLLSINEGAKGSYYYDGEGKRIRKNYSNSDVVYLYDQWGNVIAETDIYGNLMCDYIWANGRLVAKIYQDQFYPESFGEVGAESESPGPPPAFLEYVFYYHLDHLGTPLALTNVARSIQWSADYLPFGEIYNELIAPVSNEVRFPGQYHDRETDLYYNWHRYYKSTLGRYYQADPLIKNGQNGEFSYAKNDPSSFTDPLGLFSINDLFTRTDYCIDKPLPYPGDDSCIKTWTGKYKVNESLFRCIVWAESGHRTDSRKVRENPAQVQTEGVGALAQCKQDLKKDTPCFKGLNNRCDSFRCGAYYLSWCGRQFPADIQNNILCYRAGPWTVNNWQAVSEDNKALYQRYLKFVMSCFMMSGYKYQVLR
jgi:RHS repeat-associated protein